jgi:biopolymer transport protein ExbD
VFANFQFAAILPESMSRLLLVLGVVLVLLLGSVAGVWWYLFGPNQVEGADLVPATTIAFATIPNATSLLTGYETSHLKTLVDSPNTGLAQDTLNNWVGKKNLDLLNTFLPNLSGQSFVAITHFDVDHPDHLGLIAAMKPKPGTGNFDAFLEKLKDTWPDFIKQGKTGAGSVAGLNYQWIQGPGATDKLCVAQLDGWIVTTWGEAPLQDWVEHYQKKSSTPSLSQDPDYQKSITRVGQGATALVYINYHAFVDLLKTETAKTNPSMADYLSKRLGPVGGAAIATRFENGDIVDRFSMLMPRQAQIDSGADVDPCAFDTLKFTGPDTLFYCAFGMNWQAYYKNLQEQPAMAAGTPTAGNPMASGVLNFLKNWSQEAGIDVQHNVIDALGSEFSLQLDWDSTTAATNPDMNVFLKVDKPELFKPVIAAVIKSMGENFAASATVKESESNGQKFATLEFKQSAFLSPTITEDGPYLGIFTTEGAAQRSYKRDPATGLARNATFLRQMGDRRAGASQIVFLDSPRLLDRAYQTAMPYLSLASMFSKDLADVIKGRKLPSDLRWLAPIDAWSFVLTPDNDGVQGYSVSGVGNQGIFLAGTLGGGATLLQTMGLIPKQTMSSLSYNPAPPPVSSIVITPPLPGSAVNTKPYPSLVLPNASAAIQGASPDPYALTRKIIYITPEGKIFFESTPVASADFSDFLKARKAADEDLKLIVNVDKDAPPDVFSLVMNAGANSGFGVLPYIHTTGKDSVPPPAASAPAAATPDASSNAAPTPATAPDAATNAAPVSVPAPDSTPHATLPPPQPVPTP